MDALCSSSLAVGAVLNPERLRSALDAKVGQVLWRSGLNQGARQQFAGKLGQSQSGGDVLAPGPSALPLPLAGSLATSLRKFGKTSVQQTT